MKKIALFSLILVLILSGCGGSKNASVEITLPASMFENQDVEQVIADAKENGVEEVKQNDDGTYTYTMSKSVHEDMMKEMKEGIDEYLDELKSGETFKSIKDIKHNNSYSEFQLIVDQAAFEKSLDSLATLGLGLQGMFYQYFDGVSADKAKVTIKVEDQGTKTVFNTIVYPDDMQGAGQN